MGYEHQPKWHILKAFLFQGKVYNLGEQVPKFMPKVMKESLYNQGKIAKINQNGSLDIFVQPLKLELNDLDNISDNPRLLAYILSEYHIFKEDLIHIQLRIKERSYFVEFEGLLKNKLKGAIEKSTRE